MLRSLFSLTAGARGSTDYIFPRVRPEQDGEDCLKDCADCTVRCPSNVKIDTSRPLYGQIKPFHAHILVATGQSDWVEKVEKDSGSLMEALDAESGGSKLGVCIAAFE